MNDTAHLTRRARIAAVMAGMAARDPSALAEFLEDFRPTLATVMRTHLADMGWHQPDPEIIHDVVVDAALELWRAAGSWRPDGGAAPWHWARGRLRAVAACCVGQHASDIDDLEVADPRAAAGGGSVGDPVALLRSLADGDPVVRLLADALDLVASERDRAVFLESCLEQAGGNRSPAVTVAVTYDMTPAGVRKVVERVRRRLEALTSDHHYAPLVGLPALGRAA